MQEYNLQLQQTRQMHGVLMLLVFGFSSFSLVYHFLSDFAIFSAN